MGRRGLAAGTTFAGPAFVVPWRLWLHFHHLPTSSPDYRSALLLHPVALAHRFRRFTTASHVLLNSLFSTERWLVCIPVALAAVVITARRAPVESLAAAAFLTAGLIGLAAIYWIGTIGLSLYLSWSADRVSSTLAIVAATLTPVLLGRVWLPPGGRPVTIPSVTTPSE